MVALASGREGQKDHKFEISVSYVASPIKIIKIMHTDS